MDVFGIYERGSMMNHKNRETKITYFLIASMIIIFFLEFVFPLEEIGDFVPENAFSRPWTFITSIFLHADFTHIFFNMFALFMFGPYLEGITDKKTYLAIFFISGIIGNIGYMITAPDSSTPGLGASGAIYGILGSLAVLRPRMLVFIGGIPMPMIFAAFFWAMIEFFGLFTPGDIAHGAHLGGLFFGILYGFLIRSRRTESF
jgi:hypothetical protein